MKTPLRFVGIVLCLALAMPALGDTVELEDDLGRTVTIDQPCQKIVFLGGYEPSGGNLVAFGRPEEVMTPEKIAEAYGMKVEVLEHKGRRILLPL